MSTDFSSVSVQSRIRNHDTVPLPPRVLRRAQQAPDTATQLLSASQRRQATEDEERWLEMQELEVEEWVDAGLEFQEELEEHRIEEMLEEVDAWHAEEQRLEEMMEGMEKEAETFNQEEELEKWTRAQEEVAAAEELERVLAAEEVEQIEFLQAYEEVAQLQGGCGGGQSLGAANKDLPAFDERAEMADLLQRGSRYLLDERLMAPASYGYLSQIQTAAQHLINLLNQGKRAVLERERLQGWALALEARAQLRQEKERAAAQEAQLHNVINDMERQRHEVLEQLDKERERTNCRICFNRRRNVTILPCSKLSLRTLLLIASALSLLQGVFSTNSRKELSNMSNADDGNTNNKSQYC